MLHPDTEARTDPLLPHPSRPARAARGAERARQSQRRRRIATVAAVTLFLMAFGIARAWAHTIDVAVEEICVEGKTYLDVTVNSQRGDYRFAGTATDSEGHSVPVAIAAGGGSTTVRLGPVSGSGQVQVVGDFYKESGGKAEHMDRTVRYRLLENCKPTPTTTTTPPPTTAPPVTTPPPDDTPKVGPPDQHPTPAPPQETPPEVTPPAVEQPQPGTLPFTGPRDWLLPSGLVLVLTGALMVGAGRRRYQQLSLVEKAVDRAMHKPYRGPHEPV